MSRDALADLLWSDRGSVQAKSSLRQTIFELQHFECGGSRILVAGRDDLAVQRDHLVTDVELVRAAAAEGDWARLLALLEGSEPGLLTDLDGLDPEFDDWLRQQRAQEPARMLAATVGAADRCRAEAGPRAALDLVSEILRLDPVNEEATRLALEIDHELGDSRALHQHYQALAGRLRDDYDAEPSAETSELFRRLSVGTAPKSERNQATATDVPPAVRRHGWLSFVVPLTILTVALALLATLFVRQPEAAPASDGPLLIAVLPFDQQPPGDRFLAEGLWEDTRSAISRNSGLRVLGRATTREVAERKLAPGQYRRQLGVDYLLEGSIRRSGGDVIVAITLTQTSDGLSIWDDRFRVRLGDPVALQEAIASGIEGKLRGRLAPGGGRRPDQIATTPEVYALYSEARSLLRSRDVAEARRAEALLRKAIAADPNFAPAWSSLASALYFGGFGPIADAAKKAESRQAARRAVALAPNLAEAQATLALIQGVNAPSAEGPVRRALQLDPSYVEAWNWLGNALNSQGRYPEAAAAYERAIELDPFWHPPVHNLVGTASAMGDRGLIERLFVRIRRAGAGRELIRTTRAQDLMLQGDYSAAYETLRVLRSKSGRPPNLSLEGWCEILLRLGYPEETARLAQFPDWWPGVVRSERLPPSAVDGKRVTPDVFWSSPFFSVYASRALVNLGQGAELVRSYRAGFAGPDAFVSEIGDGEELTWLAPALAVPLRQQGAGRDADYILANAARGLERLLAKAPRDSEASAQLAQIRAAQGDRKEALRLLSVALEQGWLPNGRYQALDIAQEPAYHSLRGDPRFEAARKRILDHIAKERAELGPLKV